LLLDKQYDIVKDEQNVIYRIKKAGRERKNKINHICLKVADSNLLEVEIV
jgi:hypothetical protein